MPGRSIPTDSELRSNILGFGDQESAQRRTVLKQTLNAFRNAEPPDYYHQHAKANLERWHNERKSTDSKLVIEVLPGDWGDVTQTLTKRYGTCFAVLNMANAYVPGGAYVEGAVAQEENMFRRTDCHFHISDDEYDIELDRYRPEITRLLSAKDGVVYLDTKTPRTCIRGSEDRTQDDLGYPWLADDEIFPFFELRASAQDLRDGSPFDAEKAWRRIAAQLDTLRQKNIRHVVLGAFGCGAFRNPAHHVAQIYKEEIDKRQADFSVIAFAIFAAGYGPGNYTPFAAVFANR